MLTNYLIKYYGIAMDDNTGNGTPINDTNYEYYFMLYVDNELTNREKTMVDLYLQQHPSLLESFTKLKMASLPLENVSMPKDSLLKETIITKENVESYFLLSLDNELTKEETTKLNFFLQDNPSIEKSLFDFQKTKLADHTYSFNKSLLFKTNNPLFANQNNIAEILSLYIDEETTQNQNIAIKDVLKDNPALQQELYLLQQTKLQKEQILFPNKSILYKKEAKVRPLIPVWLRYSAAACLVIVVSLFVINNYQKTPNDNPVDVLSSSNPIEPVKTIPQTENTNKNNFGNPLPAKSDVVVTNDNNKLNVDVKKAVKNPLNQNSTVTNNNTVRNTNTNNVVQKTVLPNNVVNEVSTIAENNSSLVTAISSSLQTKDAIKLDDIKTISLQNNAIAATFASTRFENDNDVSILNIDADKLDKRGNSKRVKSKIGSFFQQKLESISNTSIAVGKYEIALSKPK